MANVIHMETEQAYMVARQLGLTSEEIYSLITAIGGSLKRMNWQGPTRDEFIKMVEEAEGNLKAVANQGDTLSLRLFREIDEWVSVDNKACMSTVPRWEDIIVTPGGPSHLEEGEYEPYKWWKLPKAIYKFIKEIIKKPGAAKKFPFISILLGIGEDLIEGDNPVHAVGSEVAEGMINMIPIFYLYTAILVGLQLAAGISEVVGDHEAAVKIQELASRADFADHLGDAIADFYMAHPEKLLIYGPNPERMIFDPDFQKFGLEFWKSEFETWGWDEGSAFVETLQSAYMENIEGNQQFFILNSPVDFIASLS